MPRTLLNRLAFDSVREFRAATGVRFLDGVAAAGTGRRTAAVYLFGYAAEMTVKAAYFARIGKREDDPITDGDRTTARARGVQLGVHWPAAGWGHNVRAWAELLVRVRASTPGWAYPDVRFGRLVERQGRVIEGLWREVLRYHKNAAYEYEVRHVRGTAEWLYLNAAQL